MNVDDTVAQQASNFCSDSPLTGHSLSLCLLSKYSTVLVKCPWIIYLGLFPLCR